MPPGVGAAAGGDPTGATSAGLQMLGSTLSQEQEKLARAGETQSAQTDALNQKTTTAPIADGMTGAGSATANADARNR